MNAKRQMSSSTLVNSDAMYGEWWRGCARPKKRGSAPSTPNE
jgi:hypothetical protein